ncbi:MAG: methylmalonyl-CoA mutase [Flavobacteriia bacterium]|nr:methylmalonyl-CoA mutase [Flavobacteriia bacterium]OIP46741.1 MAG: methylmalonyl-CoA mutase [Flavobacteriaceae bacterium CG2_30_31_66]PIV95798.1 MAG: methylmalonyl-CoA mutase [Flavobacteriaceae bacterium CG17_big_fil_post_rev_8_21_14_2_50_31_13]PIX13227.1 MAG: methylmalonyl-CoA mutase [Flavobacteriaceae bacterium CG_4_8_14_3_um_filter_31_8]PIY16133.1 MAG: methylmalonyl-CoA mutase [Flavobacteriaceae bacterium CG_4_10_14_3_um_filter_31_253]PIZ11314.1 MAG: methylmalonyl-CoA mutase [Flavobacter
MSTFLFDEFSPVSAAAWKQKIQAELKGADYETLLWKTDEGITVKPFYTKEDCKNIAINLPKKGFYICQNVFIDHEKTANFLAKDALKRGATAIHFKANKTFDYQKVLQNIDVKSTNIYFKFTFLDDNFQIELSKFCNSESIFFQTDIIGNLAENGNWFFNMNEDHKRLKNISNSCKNSISVSLDLYQNAGATISQQLGYALAHANEYLLHFGKEIAKETHFSFAVGSNYFFEIAKLRAFRILWETLLNEYGIENSAVHIFTQPSLRNKTIYDYNVNMLRTTSECMSAILGGSNTISNVSYDAIFHKSNEFGERISRNQLLILQQESYLQKVQNFADGSYYIDAITSQLAEKGLAIFKQIEKGGGFLDQLKSGMIQKKIKESAQKEEADFMDKKIVLVGTNLQQNNHDRMKNDLEIYPFSKQRNIKTLLTPITRKRLSETIEKERIDNE